MDELLNAEQVAELLDIHYDSVTDLAADGRLPAAKIGRAWLFHRTDVVAFVREEIKRQTALRKADPKGPVSTLSATPTDLETPRRGPGRPRKSERATA